MQRLLLRRFLEKSFGTQVVEASDGEQGLEKIAEEQVETAASGDWPMRSTRFPKCA